MCDWSKILLYFIKAITQYQFDNWGKDFVYEEETAKEEKTENATGDEEGPEKNRGGADGNCWNPQV